ncbi:MAG: phage tail tape measure protein [Desulfobacteraceae bacterium]|nr:phage tail tape measure protein [Desulfobacteraceae bacterium]
MSNQVSIELIGRAGRLLRELDRGSAGMRKFGGVVKGELAALRNMAGSVQGKLAGLGLSVGGAAVMRQSAQLDKRLIQIGQTAGASKSQVADLRKELASMGKGSGQQIDGLVDGFNNLIQAGQSFKASIESVRAINIASAVSGAGGGVLSGGLTVGAAAFNFDLEKPRQALELLDKMMVAGRQGNAELENLSSIFARVGVNAADAGMSFDKTLAFIETLSMVERAPERLATLADSTLRLFTNMRYMAKAQQATGVKFFDEKTGKRRDPVAILKDIRAEYAKLGTDMKRTIFIQKAFGEADLDTIKGMRTLLGGNFLEKTTEFERQIGQASGTLEKDFKAATDNLIDQAGRLRETLREAADGFTKPMRDTLADWIKWGLDEKKLSGGQILGGGAALAAGGAAVARYGPKALSSLAKRFGADAGGITAGLAVEAATGVQPVFVTNWPGNMSGIPSVGDKSKLLTGAAALRYGIAGAALVGLHEIVDNQFGMGARGIKQSYEQFADNYGGMLDLITGARDWSTGELKQPITINLPVTIEQQSGRVTVSGDDMNTKVNAELRRGRFDQ